MPLPAGLLNSDIEFFVCEYLNAFKLKDGRVIPFEHFDEEFLQALYAEIKKQPLKMVELQKMGLLQRNEQVKQYLVCNYGRFDSKADFKDGKLQATEYWPCPKRGTCKHEGKLCDSLRTDTGAYLTKREVQVLELIARGFLDKEIAASLNISAATLPDHTKSLREKTGLARKADLTRFALQKGLI